MRCKGNYILTIISTCRVNPFNAAGENTIYQQQQTDYLQMSKRVTDTRHQICKDLEKFVTTLLEAEHKIMLFADTNDDINKPKSGMWNTILAKLDFATFTLQNIHTMHFPELITKGQDTLI